MQSTNHQTKWYILYSILFGVIWMAMLFSLYHERGSFPQSIPAFDLVIIILATFRLTRLFVYDKITHFVRDMFQNMEEEYSEDGVTYFRKVERKSGLLYVGYELLICPWCFSLWAALFVSYAYFWEPEIFWLPILIIAISGVASLVQIFANYLGWAAENKKLDATSKHV